jgi:hypothetical protein
MRSLDRFLLLPLLSHLSRRFSAPAEPSSRIGDRSLRALVGGILPRARALVRRCLAPLRKLFGPRATDPEIHVIAAASSATTKSAGTDGTESAAHDARRRHGPRRVIVRLLPAAPTFAPQTT